MTDPIKRSICAEHVLKIEGPWFQAVYEGRKSVEIRKNDRDFQTGDRIAFQIINEDGSVCFNAETFYEITHVLKDVDGLAPDYVALSIRKFIKYA